MKDSKRPDFVQDNIAVLGLIRERRGFTQQALATKSGLSVSNIKAYELGVSKPKQASYNKLAEFLSWQKWEV